MRKNILEIRVYLEKIPDRGEDAKPISLYNKRTKSGLISVFDGLGGAGGAVYKGEDNSSHTGAYFASRLARETVKEYFNALFETESTEIQEKTTWGDLKAELGEKFKKKAAELDKNPSIIKSPLIKRLPTTMAAIYFRENPENSEQYMCYPIWAGDSRCYVLTSREGLQQLTQDELILAGDAFENIRDESPLTNCINADTDFWLRSKAISERSPCVLLVATDGCFGYLSTPMHFENLLLRTLQMSEDEKRWEEKLIDKFQKIAGDDVSMAIVAIGWDDDFKTFKQGFKDRYDTIKKTYIDKLDKIDQEIENLEQKKQDHINKRKHLHKKYWEKYKSTYDRTSEEVS